MKKLILIYSLSLLAGACAKQKLNIDPAFEPQFEAFQSDMRDIGIEATIDDLSIQFGEPENIPICGIGAVACCQTDGDTTPQITVKKQYWDNYNSTERELLIFHEMGHCVVGREHRTDVNSQGIPYSIMFPVSTASKLVDQYELTPRAYFLELWGLSNGPKLMP